MTDQERWDARYGEDGARQEPSPVLIGLSSWLPTRGRALDLAGGGGRHARWLERRGLEVTLADVSPVALQLARSAGFAGHAVRADLAETLPRGPWDLVVVFHFLDRAVLGRIGQELAPGGLLVVVHPTRRNLERHARPSSRWLLDEGELPRLVPDLEVLHHVEDWSIAGRHEAVLVARRSAAVAPR